jgi:aminoacrylate peracid reductase
MRSRIAPPPNFAPLLQPFSAARVCDNVIYLSGLFSLDENGNLFGLDDIGAQTEYIIHQIRSIVAGCGGTLKDVTFNQIFIASLTDYDAMNEVYREYFSEEPPARCCVRAELLRPEYLVQIASVAHLNREAWLAHEAKKKSRLRPDST